MNRRHLLALSATVLSSMPRAARAAETPWLMRVVPGPREGDAWLAGLEIILQPHWKTYWRVPGQGGVPPDVTVKGANIKASELLLPTPTRLQSAGGEAIGYREQVTFLLRVTPIDPGKPVAGDVAAFIGVCEDICIPAQFAGHVEFGRTANDDALAHWRAAIPQAADFVTLAKAIEVDGQPALQLDLSRPVDDIFVEGSALHYFEAPSFDGPRATLKVAGAGSVDELRKVPLRITARIAQGGLEQTVTVV